MRFDLKVLFTIFLFVFLIHPPISEAATETVKIYGGSGDGEVGTGPYPGTWEDQHDDIVGRIPNTISNHIRVKSGAYYTPDKLITIDRGFLVFDTSVIPDEAQVLSAHLNLYFNEVKDDYDDEYGYISVLEGLQASPEALVGSDIDNCGDAITNPTKGSEELDATVLKEFEYTKIELNEEGKTWVSTTDFTKLCVREGHDIENIEVVKNDTSIAWWYTGVIIASSEASDPNTRPYLEITYETTPEEPENKYPLYTQIVSTIPPAAEAATWAGDTYANGTSYCGSTIAQCGCAISSLVMLARAEGVDVGVDGTAVNPGNLNTWLKAHEGYTSFGAIKWSKAFDYFGKKNEDDENIIETSFKLKTHNATSTKTIQAAATSTEHVIGFSDKVASGHYFVVSDYVDGEYQIRDPWYYNTETLNDIGDAAGKVKDYDNDLDKANIISFSEAEQLAGFLDIILASPAELSLEDEEGQVTGYGATENTVRIPTSSYDPLEFIGDPDEPSGVGEPHYIKRLMVLEASGVYILEVVGTGSGDYTLAISLRDTAGGSHGVEIVAPTIEGQIDRYLINMETGEVVLISGNSDQLNEIIDSEIEDGILNRFFKRWAEKIFGEIHDEKLKQATEHIDTFKKLMLAKKVESLALLVVLEELQSRLEE